MFDLINGLPLHPLVVHAVVVLLPLGILGTIAISVRPSWRHAYGWLVVAVTAVGVALIPVATSSGEDLQKRVGDPGDHAELGEQLLWISLPMLLMVAALVYLDRRSGRLEAEDPVDTGAGQHAARTGSRALTWVAVLAVFTSVAAGVQVYRVGDSGARAAWGNQVAAPK